MKVLKPQCLGYNGWKNCLRLSNGVLECVVTLDVGPRIIRLARPGGLNLFKEFADQCGRIGDGEWLSYGGHRLWQAPEQNPLTYYPDNHRVDHVWDGGTLTLTPPEQNTNHLQFSMQLTLDPDRPFVIVNHRIANNGRHAVELAAWCLSVMAAGGRAVFPQEDFVPHGVSVSPARPLVLWRYTKMNDPRFIWGEKYVQIRQDDAIPAKLKIGAMNSKGWAAYLLGDTVFIKHFPYDPATTYADMGCNCEFYTEPGFLEVESLGPLSRLEPGDFVEHTEHWSLAQASISEDEEDLSEQLLPLVTQQAIQAWPL